MVVVVGVKRCQLIATETGFSFDHQVAFVTRRIVHGPLGLFVFQVQKQAALAVFCWLGRCKTNTRQAGVEVAVGPIDHAFIGFWQFYAEQVERSAQS